MISTLCGRPMSRLSATRASKKPRAWRGASKTIAREISTCRSEISHSTRRRGVRAERQRQLVEPPLGEHVDGAGAEPSQIALQCGRVIAGGEPEPGPLGLALDPLMAVEPDPGRAGNQAQTPDEGRTEIASHR
jgi:hypothetical protein